MWLYLRRLLLSPAPHAVRPFSWVLGGHNSGGGPFSRTGKLWAQMFSVGFGDLCPTHGVKLLPTNEISKMLITPSPSGGEAVPAGRAAEKEAPEAGRAFPRGTKDTVAVTVRLDYARYQRLTHTML